MPKVQSVPRYLLHKPSGRARVIIRGKQHYLGPYGSPESREKYGRLIAELSVGKEPDAPRPPGAVHNMLIVELAARYWEFAEGYYVKDGRPTGHIHTVRVAIKALRELYAHTPANEFGPLAFRALRQKFIEAGRVRRYVNQVCDTIRRIFKWGASNELLPETVYRALSTVPGLRAGRTTAKEPAPVLPVADDVVDATLPYLPPVVVDMVRFQRLTGCRPGEVCSVRPIDVDRTSEVWEYRPAGHKTAHLGRERVICIGPQAQEALRPYLLRAADAYCFSPAESEAARHADMREARKTKVQPSQVNRRKPRPKRKPRDHYTKDGYCRAVARAVVLANKQCADGETIPHWHPNQLRHSLATRVRREFGLEAAQVTLGHSRADVTQVYAERDSKLATEVARRIG